MKIKTIIIDDESAGRNYLSKLIEEYIPSLTIVGVADSALEGIKLLKAEKVDLIFLDVEMPNGTGFDLIDAIEKNQYKIVLTTAYPNFALKAFKYRVDGYLLKPIDIDDLEILISDFYPIKNPEIPQEKRIVFRTQESIEYIDPQTIIRIETIGNYATIYCLKDRKLLVSKNMKEIELMLNSSDFIKSHKSHLINIRYIKRFLKQDGGFFEMSDTSTVPVSRRKKDEILRLLE